MGTSENLNKVSARRVRLSVSVPVAATGANWPDGIFIADVPMELISFEERHTTAGNDGGAVSCKPVKCNDAEAVGAGDDMTSDTVNLKGTANTIQSLTPATDGKQILAAGDSIHLSKTGTLTTLAGVCITIVLREVSLQ